MTFKMGHFKPFSSHFKAAVDLQYGPFWAVFRPSIGYKTTDKIICQVVSTNNFQVYFCEFNSTDDPFFSDLFCMI